MLHFPAKKDCFSKCGVNACNGLLYFQPCLRISHFLKPAATSFSTDECVESFKKQITDYLISTFSYIKTANQLKFHREC